jgi:hypothetical protein
MLKTLTAIAALAALLAVNITPAHAAIFPNGTGDNGLQLNGGGDNGIHLNGGGENGLELNGGGSNGIHLNGGGENGISRNGGGTNGVTEQSSTLSINAFELPPEKR